MAGRRLSTKELLKAADDWMRADPRIRMWETSKNSARIKQIEHTIEYTDIPTPEFCCYLGIRLDYRRAKDKEDVRADNTPSIDRIDNTLGYVRGNIQVISNLANRMKANASIELLIAFAEGVIRTHCM
jgi:hypothetical protein